MNIENFTNQELEEFNNISRYQPVDAGNVISKQTAKSLIDKGYVMQYEGKYVLSDKGQEVKERCVKAATKIVAVAAYSGIWKDKPETK